MSLIIYSDLTEKPNSIVLDNDLYFNMYNKQLKNDTFYNLVIEELERGTYTDKYNIKSRFGWNINSTELSTGAKTLLNIYNTNECFSLLDCGNNALKLLHNIKDGKIYWESSLGYFSLKDFDCDILFNNFHFTKFNDFIRQYDSLYNKNIEV